MRRVLLCLLLLACRAEPEMGDIWISPVDGKTDVELHVPLRVHVGGLQLPPDYPVPDDFIRVVDVESGGFVPGRILPSHDVLSFIPDGGWEPGKQYVWSVGVLPTLDRGPEHFFPEAVYGEATFATTQHLDVLEGIVQNDGRVCLMLSRKLLRVFEMVRMTVDEIPVDPGPVALHAESLWLDDFPVELIDQGVTIACFSELQVEPGASVRVWWGSRPPFQTHVERRDMRDVLVQRRRAL